VEKKPWRQFRFDLFLRAMLLRLAEQWLLRHPQREQTHAARRCQIWIHSAAIIGIDTALDAMRFKIAAGKFCGVVAAENMNSYDFHFAMKTIIAGF